MTDHDAEPPRPRLLSWPAVREKVGISRTTAWRLQQTGGFPASVALSPGRVGWWESELEAWRKNRNRRRWRGSASPRLKGTAPRSRMAGEEGPAPASAATPKASAPRRPRRPSGAAVHPDQIDFGF